MEENPNSARSSSKQERRQEVVAEEGVTAIDRYELHETTRKVNSPRSVEACQMEGVDPEELLYVYARIVTR